MQQALARDSGLKWACWFVCGMAAVAVPGCAHGAGVATLTAGRVTLHLSRDSGRIVGLSGGGVSSRGEGGLYVFDGASKQEFFPARLSDWRQTEDALEFAPVSDDPELEFRCELRRHERLVTWRVDVTNRGVGLRLIEVRIGLPLVLDETWHYWDGYDGDLVAGPTRQCTAACNFYACNAAPTVLRGDDPEGRRRSTMKWHRLGNVGMFPLNVVCSGGTGLALGIAPEQLLSYYSGGVQPSHSPRESFYYAVKLVVDSGKTEGCTFVIFGFDSTYGYRKALETYQHHFAQVFRLRAELDPRVLLPANGTYLAQHWALAEHGLTDLWAEFCRRYSVGWTWLYAPFQRSGDFWPEEDTFGVEHWRRPSPDCPATLAEHRRRMVAGNEAVRRGCAIGYYIITERCQRALAAELYADSHLIRTDGSKHHAGAVLGWPLTTVFAMNNSFGRNCADEVAKILRLAQVDGIAFDNAMSLQMHTGGGMMAAAGRAFYEGKPYVLNHLACRHQMDAVRRSDTRTPDGYRPAVFANNATNIMTAQATDVGLIEYHPYPAANTPGRFSALRYLFGPHKPINFKVHGRSKPGSILDREAPSQDEIDDVMNQRLYSLFMLLRWGAYPRIREALGSADLIEVLPLLVELRQAGWQPVPAVKGGAGLWIERFGTGIDTHLVLINPTETPFSGELEFDHVEAGMAPTSFARVYGDGELSSRVAAGRSLFTLSIPPAWLQVVRPKGGERNGTSARGIGRTWFVPDAKAVMAMPYLDGAVPDVVIVVPPDAAAAVSAAAQRIRAYFTYWQLAERFEMWFQTNGRTPVPEPETVTGVRVVAALAEARAGTTIVLEPDSTGASSIAVGRDGILRLRTQPGAVAETVDALLRLLDRRFRRYGCDGLFNQSPSAAGQLAPDSGLFRRRGWAEQLKAMQERSARVKPAG